jgi:DNA helicase-2/ATP-dependent DNA helicase PcrA
VSRLQIILGPPGTGKTTSLIRLLEQVLKTLPSERIAFVSFSRRAIREVAERVGVDPEHYPHFRTIHSTAYHQLGLTRDDVFQPKHWRAFSEIVGLPITAAGHEEPLWDGTLADKCLAIQSLASARGTALEHEWRNAMLADVPLATVQYVVQQYQRFKDVNCLWDFHDMITRATGDLPVEVLFVDEAQDTSAAQWTFLRKATRDVARIVLAGDDDQAVYAWSGADGDALRRFAADRVVLPHSYRLPPRIHALAQSIVQRIKTRIAKDFTPSEGRNGTVDWFSELDHIDLRGKETWLLLARSNYQLEAYRELARRQGVIYNLEDGNWSWSLPAVRAAISYEKLRRGHPLPRAEAKVLVRYVGTTSAGKLPQEVSWTDLFSENALTMTWMEMLTGISPSDREYIRALRAGGESLTKPGRVRIGTVHSVKGAEADHVVLLTDVSQRVAHGARLDPDAEHRVQYVAVTRARVGLHLILPQTATHWAF